jgi:hypothetical protein
MYPSAEAYNRLIANRDNSTFATLSSWQWWTAGGSLDNFIFHSGQSAVICKAEFRGQPYTLKLFTAAEQGREEHYAKIVEYLKTVQPSWNPELDLLKKEICSSGKYYPAVLYRWTDGIRLHEYVGTILHDNDQLSVLQKSLVQLSRELERCQIVHGQLEPKHLLVSGDQGKPVGVVPVDYDELIFLPATLTMHRKTTVGSLQHPRRIAMKTNYHIDRFPIWCMLCALEALKWDKSLWNSVKDKGFNNGQNVLFTANDFLHFDQSILVQHLYSLNLETLNFYLYALNRFVHSRSNYVEEPEMHGDEIPGVAESKRVVSRLTPNHDAIQQDRPQKTSVTTSLHQTASTASPAFEPRKDDVTIPPPASIVDVNEAQQEEGLGRLSSLFVKAALAVAAVVFVVVTIISLSSHGDRISEPVVPLSTDTVTPVKHGSIASVIKPVIAKSKIDESLVPLQVDTFSVDQYVDSVVKALDGKYGFNEPDATRNDDSESSSLTNVIKQTDTAPPETISFTPTFALTEDEAEQKKEVVLHFFDLIQHKRAEEAWELVKDDAFKNKGRAWFLSDRGYGYVWQIQTDEISLLSYSDRFITFRVQYYTYDIYEGAKCLDQRIELKRISKDKWIINNLINVVPPVKCEKR